MRDGRRFRASGGVGVRKESRSSPKSTDGSRGRSLPPPPQGREWRNLLRLRCRRRGCERALRVCYSRPPATQDPLLEKAGGELDREHPELPAGLRSGLPHPKQMTSQQHRRDHLGPAQLPFSQLRGLVRHGSGVRDDLRRFDDALFLFAVVAFAVGGGGSGSVFHLRGHRQDRFPPQRLGVLREQPVQEIDRIEISDELPQHDALGGTEKGDDRVVHGSRLGSVRGRGAFGSFPDLGFRRVLRFFRRRLLHHFQEPRPLDPAVVREDRRSEGSDAVRGGRRQRSPDRPGHRHLVDVEVRIYLRGDALQRQEGPDQQQHVGRGLHLPLLAQAVQHGGERAEPGGSALGALHSVPKVHRQPLDPEVLARHGIVSHRDELGALVRAVGLPLDRVRYELGRFERLRQGPPVLREAGLDALSEGLHDGVIHIGHEAEIEEDGVAVFVQHQVPLVGIRVDEPGQNERRRAGLHRHAGQRQPLLLRQVAKVVPLHELRHQHALGGVLLHHLRRLDESQEAERLLELDAAFCLLVIIQLVGHVRRDAGDGIADQTLVEGHAGLHAARELEQREANLKGDRVLREERHPVRPLDLHGDVDALVRGRLVDLPQRGGRDRRLAHPGEERLSSRFPVLRR
mmetsp:Transcript_24336/g.57278  ORF Transcript_24336/g.57278 Transcript_24336/m.57278 type:complete len:628 (+) Transcript_24336:257-2140(+)